MAGGVTIAGDGVTIASAGVPKSGKNAKTVRIRGKPFIAKVWSRVKPFIAKVWSRVKPFIAKV